MDGVPRPYTPGRPVPETLTPAISGNDTFHIDRPVVGAVLALADRCEIAWATTCEHCANALVWPPQAELPVVRVLSNRSESPDGFDCAKIHAIRAYVETRPFAWLNDQVIRPDAHRLLVEHDCPILRGEPRRGI